jgi:hypothetical protein
LVFSLNPGMRIYSHGRPGSCKVYSIPGPGESIGFTKRFKGNITVRELSHESFVTESILARLFKILSLFFNSNTLTESQAS